MEEETPPVRVRLVFDDRHLLKKTQREDGLRRCWLLLRPELATVADLAAHIARRFRLRRSCPDGLLLSMDEFVLPPFEPTCIFRDKDIIRVKQKLCKKIIEHNDVHCVQDSEILEKLPLPTNDEILAIEFPEDSGRHQMEKDSGRHQREKKEAASQHEENATLTQTPEIEDTSSKRKRRDVEKPEGPKKKKSKVTDPEEPIISAKKDESVHLDQDQNCSKKIRSSQQNCTKGLLLIGTETVKASTQTEGNVILKEAQKVERNNQAELNCQTKTTDPNAESATRKSPSRSARRKKLKRQYMREAKCKLKVNSQSQASPSVIHCPSSSNPNGLHYPSSSNPSDLHCPSSCHEAAEQESDASDEIVPVVVRPGHIRFEPTGGEPSHSQANEPQATLQWSGIINKKKGQKWGMNNKKNGDSSYYGRTNRRNYENNHNGMDNRTNENGFCGTGNQKNSDSSYNESASTKLIAGKSISEHLDFESLYPLTRLPKERDLIVYRLVELSSSWCPELSPYRVGEVLIYDPISLRIILLPVPDYPIFPKENKGENESDMQSDMSPYKEDGSLEIEYSSLIDVRLLKDSQSELVTLSTLHRETGKKGELPINKQVTLGKNKGKIDNTEVPLVHNSESELVTASTLHRETGQKGELPINKQVTLGKNKGKIDNPEVPLVHNSTKDLVDSQDNQTNKGWEEIGQALNDKKVELQENGWETWTPNKSTSTTTSSWSYRALRGSALGPTVAFLRGKNSQKGKPSNPKFRK